MVGHYDAIRPTQGRRTDCLCYTHSGLLFICACLNLTASTKETKLGAKQSNGGSSMIDEQPTSSSIIRIATPEDIAQIEELDSLSTSPTRNIHREMEKYFGSVDPTTHEKTLIFLYEVDGVVAAKAELMLPPLNNHDESWQGASGYVKRVIVRPEFRQRGLARNLMLYIIAHSQKELQLSALDLHVWEMNLPAIRLYENLGFELKHRELYFRLPL